MQIINTQGFVLKIGIKILGEKKKGRKEKAEKEKGFKSCNV
jgi:hypothetical protein